MPNALEADTGINKGFAAAEPGKHDRTSPDPAVGGGNSTCETCRFWKRGTVMTINGYGDTPERPAWASIKEGQWKHYSGECRIVAPWRCGGYFPTTFEFQGCGEYQEAPTS